VIQHTALSLALIQAGIETPLYHKRALWMSQPTFWLARLSYEKRGVYGIARDTNMPIANPPRKFK